MALRLTAPARLLLSSMAAAGALAGTVGKAAAQYYYYEDEVPARDYYYGERYAPRPPVAVPRATRPLAARDLGLARIDRSLRVGSTYIVDGWTPRGSRERLIFDARSGELVDRITLLGAPRERTARVDPRDDDRPAARVVPRPPERPPALKPPPQANAPASREPRLTPEPTKPAATLPAEKPPVNASAPATMAPKPAAVTPVPTPGATNPESGTDTPRLVNPNDVRGSEAERTPPLAKAEPSGISVPPVQLPPVQIEDMTSASPKPATPEVPVTPLD